MKAVELERPISPAVRSCFKGVNFITPNIMTYYDAGEYYIELSNGPALHNRKSLIFGVTVVKKATGKSMDELSQLVQNHEDALLYIDKLSEGKDVQKI